MILRQSLQKEPDMSVIKILNLLFILLFLIAAFLQLNDPDPLLWFGLYSFGAIACTLAILNKTNRNFLWFLLGFYAVYAIYIFFSTDGVLSWYRDHGAENIAQSMKADKPWIESSREFFGLLILAAAVGLNLLSGRKFKSKSV